MNRVFAVLQFGIAALLLFFSIVTLVNMLLIALRPETISVVNVFVGQIVLIACMLALAKILYKKAKLRMQQNSVSDDAPSTHQEN